MIMSHTTRFREYLKILFGVLHPFLFAIWPVLSLYAHNAYQIHPVYMVRPLLLLLPITAFLILFFRIIARSFPAAAIMTTLSLVFFFGLWPVIGWKFLEGILKPAFDIRLSILFSIYVVVISVLLIFIARVRFNLKTFTRFLNGTGIALISIPLLQTLLQGNWGLSNQKPSSLPGGIQVKEELPDPLPDIYFIVLDAYGREDVLRELYNYDNSDFLQKMRDRGFQVAENSLSCYPNTTHSLATCLNMGHIKELFSGDSKRTDSYELEIATRYNTVHRILQGLGYRICVFPTGWYSTEPSPEFKIHILDSNKRIDPNLFEVILLDSTPIMRLLEKFIPSTHERWYHRIIKTFEYLPKIRGLYPDCPIFVQAHIIAPHYPFVLNADGTARIISDRFGLGAPNEESVTPEVMEESCRMYIEQLQAVNMLVKNAVDQILENSPSQPIILIVSDHGPFKYYSRLNRKDPIALWERYSNLTLTKFPSTSNVKIPNDLHLVNLFPVALSDLFEIKPVENSCWIFPIGSKQLFDLSPIDNLIVSPF